MGKTVKLLTCYNSFEANVIKGKLQSEGIMCFLNNENFNFLYGGLTTTSTGVDVMINDEDLERAELIIADVEDVNAQ